MKKQQPEYSEWFHDRELSLVEKRILEVYAKTKQWGKPLTPDEESHIVGSVVPRLRSKARITLVQLLGNVYGRKHVRHMRVQQSLTRVVDKSAIEELFAHIISANVTDVVNVHSYNCRHCWGIDHKYLWRNVEEYTAAYTQYEREIEKGNPKGIPEPDIEGGVGFVRTKSPNSNCPECGGVGESQVVIKDTRKLPDAVKMVIKSIKMDVKGNISVEFYDRIKAAEELGKILKIYETATFDATKDKNDPKYMSNEELVKMAYPHLLASKDGSATKH